MTTTTKTKPTTSLTDQAFPVSDADAVKQYALLLTRSADAKPGDAKQLKELMVQLNKSKSDVLEDIATIESAHEKESCKAEMDELYQRQITMNRESAAYRQETYRIEREREAHQNEMQSDIVACEMRYRRLTEYLQEAKAIRHRNSHLFTLPDQGD